MANADGWADGWIVRLGLMAALAAAALAPTPSNAQDASGGLDCDIPLPESPATPEWEATNETMAGLIATGDFEIKASHRAEFCGFSLYYYLLQGVADRTRVYECYSDDAYRPILPCRRLTAAQ